jgi:hypothetical protein
MSLCSSKLIPYLKRQLVVMDIELNQRVSVSHHQVESYDVHRQDNAAIKDSIDRLVVNDGSRIQVGRKIRSDHYLSPSMDIPFFGPPTTQPKATSPEPEPPIPTTTPVYGHSSVHSRINPVTAHPAHRPLSSVSDSTPSTGGHTTGTGDWRNEHAANSGSISSRSVGSNSGRPSFYRPNSENDCTTGTGTTGPTGTGKGTPVSSSPTIIKKEAWQEDVTISPPNQRSSGYSQNAVSKQRQTQLLSNNFRYTHTNTHTSLATHDTHYSRYTLIYTLIYTYTFIYTYTLMHTLTYTLIYTLMYTLI